MVITPFKKIIKWSTTVTYAVTDCIWYTVLHYHGIKVSSNWEKWYAWHPIVIRGSHVWRREVYRKAVLIKDDDSHMLVYTYIYADDIDLICGDIEGK